MVTDYPSVKIFKALGEQNRLRAVLALRGKELCVCQIVELLQLAPSTVSKHLAILKDAGVIVARKHGRWIYYSLAESDLPGVPFSLIDPVLNSLTRTSQARNDAKRLKTVLRHDPETLCERQRS